MHVLCQSCQPLGQDWDWDHKIVFCREILCFGFVFGSYVHFGWEVHVFCVLSTILCDCPCWPACSLGVPAANHYCKMQTNGFHDFMTEIAHVTILCGPCHCSICSGLVCLYLPRPGWYGDCFCLLLYYEDGMMGLWLCFIPGCFEHPILALAFLVPVPSFSFKGVGICHAIGENKPKTTVCATRLCMTVETSWRDPGESDCSSWAMGSACAATKAKQCNLRIQKKRQQLPYVWGWWGWFRNRSCMVSLVMCMRIMCIYIYTYICTIIIQLYIYIFIHTYCKYRYGCIQSYPCCLTWLHLRPACFVFRALHEPAPFLEKCSLFHGEIPMFPCGFSHHFPCKKKVWPTCSWKTSGRWWNARLASINPAVASLGAEQNVAHVFPKVEEDEIGTPGNGHKCRVNRQFCTEIPNWLGRSIERSSSAILCASNQKITQEEWIEWVNGLGCSLWFLSMNVEVSCKSTELDSGTGSACWNLGNLFIRR